MNTDASFTSVELCGILDITHRQLQFWDESGLVKAEQHGHTRYYSATKACIAAVIAYLREREVSLQTVRHLRLEDRGLLDTNWLVVCGKLAWSGDHEASVLRIINHVALSEKKGCFVVDVAEIRRRLDIHE